MQILKSLFSKSHNQQAAARPVEDLSNPQYAAKALTAWGSVYARNGSADRDCSLIILKMMELKGYQPSKSLSPEVLNSYSPEKRQICYALDGINDQGSLIGKTAVHLEFLADTGKIENPATAKADHVMELQHAKLGC